MISTDFSGSQAVATDVNENVAAIASALIKPSFFGIVVSLRTVAFSPSSVRRHTPLGVCQRQFLNYECKLVGMARRK
jgi:hypothetical protein